MDDLLIEIKKCTICTPHLEHGVNPVMTAHVNSKIVVVGQAPGSVVHRTGIPWNDKSGDRLRSWMDVSKSEFYNEENFALVPMGFCYPGRGKTGDLPPRKECAPTWHHLLLSQMPDLKLIVLVGSYAQKYYLKDAMKKTLTETVQHYEEYLPKYFPLPHPSPRNNIWMKRNEWFEELVVPEFKEAIATIL